MIPSDQVNAILSSMAEGMVVVDNDRKIILMNQAAGVLLRFAPQEAVGQALDSVFQFFKGKEAVIPEEVPVEKAIRDKNIVSISFVDNIYLKNRQGQMLPVSMMIAPLLRGQTVNGAIILLRDITKEKEVDQAKTEFVSLASHQLRTPLSAISWYGEMLLSGEVGELNPKQKEYLESLYEANRRMVELVNALLNVSRIDLGSFAIEPEPTNLAEIADSVVAELVPGISSKNIEVKKNYDPDLGLINADPRLVRIIFQNLLSNAVKYTPVDGTITLYLLREPTAIVLRVTDTGFGIPASDRARVFTKLFRSDNVKEREAEGTGLGLYIVKSIVDSAGGLISFDSLEGKGTTFTIRLPLTGMVKKEGIKELS